MERQKKGQIYKSISLYNPETRKPKVVSVKRADFETEDALNDYCKQLRDANKVKNAEWRKQKRMENYNNIKVAIPAETAKAVEETEKKETPENIENKIHASSRIKLDLDPTTGSTIVIYGSSKRGKSTLMMYLYKKYFMDKSNINTLFSGNPHLKVYKKDKRLLVGYGFGPDHAKYIQMQQFLNVKTANRYKFVNMFDDIIDQKYAQIINKLILTYRNANISMIMALQYVYLLSKQNRANVNHTFIFGMNSTEDCRGIIDLILRPYFSAMGFHTMEDQMRLFREVTMDHGFIYLDNIKNKISFHRLPRVVKNQP